MKVLERLSVSLGQRDEQANIELAERIVAQNDADAVRQLAALLVHHDKRVQSCALKAIYETAERNPELVAPFYHALLALLNSKNNRLVWGAMAGLDHITEVVPREIYSGLKVILPVMEKGSVITKDHGMKILVKLAGKTTWKKRMLGLLLDFLSTAPDNQFPTYAENISTVMIGEYKPAFTKILRERVKDLEGASKVKRVNAILKKLYSA